MRKITKTTVKTSTPKKVGKATFKDVGSGCAAVTITGELAELAAKVAKRAGVSPEEALRLALRSFLEAQEGKRAVYIPAKAYRHLDQIADALNRDTWCGADNTAQSVFAAFVLDGDLEPPAYPLPK